MFHPPKPTMRQIPMKIAIPLVLLFVTALAYAATRSGDGPTTKPAAAEVSPQVRALLDRTTDAYRGLKSLSLEGTVTADYEAGGREVHQAVDLHSARASADRFRSEISGEIVVAGTGEGVYVYVPTILRYYKGEPLGATVTPTNLGDPATNGLLETDPSLLLSLIQDPAALLRSLGKLDAASADDGNENLVIARPDESTWTLRFDGKTNLLREVEVDESATLRAGGVPDVKRATRTVRYTAVKPDADVTAEQIAFVPPSTAQQVDPNAAVATGDVTGLVGKAAPDLSLRDINGSVVSLSQFKGRVVVVDFWATWCPPCVAGMPHLTEMARKLGDAGVTVLAVNAQESADQVRQFAADNGMNADAMRVLLDADGAAQQRWGVYGFPTTVVVGRDGVVRKAIVGLDPAQIEVAVKAELAAKAE